MGRLTVTVFWDPKAPSSDELEKRMAIVAPSLHVGVSYVDITADPNLLKRYERVAPVGTVAGTIVFSGGFDEQGLRKRVKQLQKR